MTEEYTEEDYLMDHLLGKVPECIDIESIKLANWPPRKRFLTREEIIERKRIIKQQEDYLKYAFINQRKARQRDII